MSWKNIARFAPVLTSTPWQEAFARYPSQEVAPLHLSGAVMAIESGGDETAVALKVPRSNCI
jgi:hypothetical protein